MKALKEAIKERESFLTPIKEALKIKGKLLYQESAQAWTTLKMKKNILFIFPQLGEKRAKFNYTMIIPRSLEELNKEFSELKKDETKVPILLFFEKSKEDENSISC